MWKLKLNDLYLNSSSVTHSSVAWHVLLNETISIYLEMLPENQNEVKCVNGTVQFLAHGTYWYIMVNNSSDYGDKQPEFKIY